MKAIIVEDELPAREELEYLIQTHSSIEVTDSFEDGLDVFRFLQDQETDAIFLDINIPSLDGMLLAQNISKFAKKPYIIFTTAYKEHAAQAFELEAFDYILKPYDEKRIASMLHKLENAYEQRNAQIQEPVQAGQPRAAETSTVAAPGRINLLKNDKIIVTDANDIYYACAQEKVTRVFTRHEEYTMPMSISEFHARLPQQDFFRCHRSYTVNLAQIREIVPWFNHTYLLRLRGLEAEIPVSRSKAKEFRQIMRL
ncbi:MULTISPECIES: LytR/AlgR family response regulator transcription factor [Paenibacillus]|uniref:LytR/AlgR family response regulator transcription factor n=1 Tax=Paenibacillus TaxID=44249 RepID=UPI00042E5B2D|nr:MULTISPECIES: LytTR family DNA-binding domain-containing protein [Paenibacillus]AHM67404.1 two component transcriptional regulator, lyttr family [Paenibacillus polymyxa SQR-21]AIY08172.1 LytTR family transcriptional regulator [Paenibacillus polymyxa]MDU8672457.1 LytTR family DNA-binding domain-containing protein [Paenibacillus polymyxa]MDU8697364.1 LytTR family DNA-binding domain-containing protein [Paenibacillus polymyxa]QDA28153.1 response regulator transcription factor [Paenibacillus pol